MSISSISAPKLQYLDILRSVSPKEFISAPKTFEFSGKYFQGQILKCDPKRSNYINDLYGVILHVI